MSTDLKSWWVYLQLKVRRWWLILTTDTDPRDLIQPIMPSMNRRGSWDK